MKAHDAPGEETGEPIERGAEQARRGAPTWRGGLSRRQFVAGVAAVGTAGCVTRSSGQPQANPVEMEGWQVAEVRVELQHSFVGASAILYNAQGIRPRNANVRYRLYDNRGRLQYEAAEWVSVNPGEERHVARWWRLDQPATTTPPITTADVEIVAVS